MFKSYNSNVIIVKVYIMCIQLICPPLILHAVQCWEGYFENVMGNRLQVTLLKM